MISDEKIVEMEGLLGNINKIIQKYVDSGNLEITDSDKQIITQMTSETSTKILQKEMIQDNHLQQLSEKTTEAISKIK